MVDVAGAAVVAGRTPETVRRWIRDGRLPARKVRGRWVIDEDDVDALLDEVDEPIWSPTGGWTTSTGEPMPDWAAIIRENRRERAEHLAAVVDGAFGVRVQWRDPPR